MKGSWLTCYWIVPGYTWGPFGIGVTAWSIDDAIQLIKASGLHLPENREEFQITESVTFAELDQNNVVPQMGPMVMRGVWYPCLNLGLPKRYPVSFQSDV